MLVAVKAHKKNKYETQRAQNRNKSMFNNYTNDTIFNLKDLVNPYFLLY